MTTGITKEQFLRSAELRGICSKKAAAVWLEDHPKDIYTEQDL